MPKKFKNIAELLESKKEPVKGVLRHGIIQEKNKEYTKEEKEIITKLLKNHSESSIRATVWKLARKFGLGKHEKLSPIKELQNKINIL